jgi:hypothetical protein
MDRLYMMRNLWIIVALAGTVACGGGTEEPARQPGSGSPAPAATAAPVTATCAQTRDVPIPLKAAILHDMTWKDDTGHGTGADPQVYFALPDVVRTCAVRLRFSLVTADGKPAFFQVFWKRRGGDFNEKDQEGAAVASGEEQTFTANVDADIDGLRVDPDFRPVTFKLAEIVLVTPAGQPPR